MVTQRRKDAKRLVCHLSFLCELIFLYKGAKRGSLPFYPLAASLFIIIMFIAAVDMQDLGWDIQFIDQAVFIGDPSGHPAGEVAL